MVVKSKKNNKIFKGVLIFLIILAISSMIGIFTLWFKNLGLEIGGTTQTWSHFGSFFGGVLGPILSFFSFTAIICTVYLQSASNTAQASANEQAAKDRLSAEKLSARYQEEQQIAFVKKIEHEKQQHLLSFFINTFDELEKRGFEAGQDLTEHSLSHRSNAYTWKAHATSHVLKRCINKFDSESAELIHIYATKCSGQVNQFKRDIAAYHNDLINSTEEIKDLLEQWQAIHYRFESSIQVLKNKHFSIWEEQDNNRN